MSQKGSQPKKNHPYKLLYWMGASMLLLLLGVVALVMLRPARPREVPRYERTLIWLYDSANPSGPGQAAIIEEAHQEAQLVAVTFPSPDEARAVFKSQDSIRKVQQQVAALAGRQVHHRVFLPYSVVEVLIKAFGYIEVQGKRMDGPAAISFIREDEARAPNRAVEVLMAIAEAAGEREPSLGMGEALKLANQVGTDLDLMKIPEVLQRWQSYQSQKVVPVTRLTPDAVKGLLKPDPAEQQK